LIVFVCSALAAFFLQWVEARNDAHHSFEVEFASDTACHPQLFFDSGQGLSEANSIQAGPTAASEELATLRFPLPRGHFTAFRLDPVEQGPAAVSMRNARIVGPGGNEVHAFAAANFQLGESMVARSSAGAQLELVVPAENGDPTLTLVLDSPLDLLSRGSPWKSLRWNKVLGRTLLFSALIGGILAIWAAREFIRARAQNRPKTFLAVVALCSAVASSYPVVFFGKSFVSPNTNVALLYSRVPRLPGYTDVKSEDVHGSDIGAMMWQHLPYSVLQHRSLFRDGELPLWNRDNSSGVPLLGQGQSMLGDPLHLLAIFADGASWAWDLKFLIAKALFGAGLGFCVWAVTRDRLASALIAAAGAFVSFYTYRINHAAIFSVSYSPWILYFWLRAIAAADPKKLVGALVGLSVANGMVLCSGTAKEAYMLLASLNLTGVLAWAVMPSPLPGMRWKRAGYFSAVGLAFTLLTAPFWSTFVEALKHAHTMSDAPHVTQLPRSWLIGLFDDVFYRESTPGYGAVAPAGNALLLLGALWFVCQLHRAMQWRLAFALLSGWMGAIALAFGFVPVSWILAMPVVRNIGHIYNTFSAVALVLTGLVAGWGLHLARVRLARPRLWRPVTLGLLVVVGLLAAYFRETPQLWLAQSPLSGWWKHAPEHEFFYGYLGVTFAAMAAFTLVLRVHARGAALSATTAMVGAFAIGALFFRHGQHLQMGAADDYVFNPTVRADLAAKSPAIEWVTAHLDEPARVSGVNHSLFSGFLSTYGLEGIGGPDALVNRAYRELVEIKGLADPGDWMFKLTIETFRTKRSFLDFLGLRYVVAESYEPLADAGYTPVASLDLNIWESDTAWPRAFFANRLVPYATTADFLRLVDENAAGPFAAVEESEEKRLTTPLDASAPLVAVAATRYKLTSNSTAFEIDAPTPGFAVLQETYEADNFKVTLDGVEVPYFKVNFAFKGIAIPTAGKHRVEMRYRPRYFSLSLVAMALGAAGFCLLVLHAVRSSRQVRPAQDGPTAGFAR